MARMTVDFDLQFAFILDILRGLRAVHRSPVKYHGNLTIHCCLIDKHFTAKIGRAGFQRLEQRLKHNDIVVDDPQGQQAVYDVLDDEDPKHDIQAVAFVLIYIMAHEDIIKTADDLRRWRVEQDNQLPRRLNPMFSVIEASLNPSASERPSAARLLITCTEAMDRTEGSNFMEKVIRRLGTYTDELDRQVATRTLQLIDEQRRCDLLLREMLPVTVIGELRSGTIPKPEMFDLATLMFTEIGGFLNVLALTEPKDVLLFLNEVYMAFDKAVDLFDVYKVETIKDSYMVVSGIPIRNGTEHAQEICGLATRLLRTYSSIQTSFNDTAFRAGVHTGRCAAGVVGLKVPRYCLFGDTINTASRILMYGADSRVHLSSATAELIVKTSKYQVEERGAQRCAGIVHYPGEISWKRKNSQTVKCHATPSQ
ncbi:guanylate cyclase 2G-like [Paramacrobiotus metropolitanus]|uniref:guanylate cyclase 2G-like n=1 Tax=Paramacrobiotus metropolitanus TaxID=2943436 RepID=UPI002445AADC|nr:guanylate cyclase 2G-like [Paramacrobiotus metropolitanus]